MEFITGLLAIIMIDLILSGDNAVVIAMACRNLPDDLRKKAVVIGSIGAIGLRIALTFVAVLLLDIPYIQFIGGLALLWIAISLLKGGDEKHQTGGSTLISAVKTIIVADFVMSVDNVVAVAGMAHGSLLLIVIGLLISLPLIVWGSQLLMGLMNRFPIIVILGSALLGYTAGDMILHDKAIGHTIGNSFVLAWYIIPLATAVLAVVIGKLIGRNKG